jgi:hypothetical protein
MIMCDPRPEVGHEEHRPSTPPDRCVPVFPAGDRDEGGLCLAALGRAGTESLAGNEPSFVESGALALTGLAVFAEPGGYEGGREGLSGPRGITFDGWEALEEELSDDEDDYDILDDDDEDSVDDDEDVDDEDSVDDDDDDDDDDDYDDDDDFEEDDDCGLLDEDDSDY